MKKLIILLFIILTSSCSYKGVIVSNLPFLITNRVDNRFDLTSEQAKVFKGDIKKLLKDKKNEVKSFNEKFQAFNIESSNRKDFYLFTFKNVLFLKATLYTLFNFKSLKKSYESKSFILSIRRLISSSVLNKCKHILIRSLPKGTVGESTAFTKTF